jgi:K(+)-stimulated pyrophosphate-energized sodium pump
MKEIAGAIQEGADAFISHEYKVIFKIGLIIVALLTILVSWQSAVSFVIGASMSATAGVDRHENCHSFQCTGFQ